MTWKVITATVLMFVALFFAFAMPGLDNPYGWPMPVALTGVLVSVLSSGVFALWAVLDTRRLPYPDWEDTHSMTIRKPEAVQE